MSLTPNEHVVTHTWPLRSGDPTCALLAGPSPLGGWGWVVSASETFGEFVWASLTDSATFSGAELLSWSPGSFGATVACVVGATEAMVGKTTTCWSSCSAEETEVIYWSAVLPSHMKAVLFYRDLLVSVEPCLLARLPLEPELASSPWQLPAPVPWLLQWNEFFVSYFVKKKSIL